MIKKILRCLPIVVSSLSLSACAGFKVTSEYNKFRDTTVCKTQNNFIKGGSGGLSFDFTKDTGTIPPYTLTVTQTSTLPVSFKNDSHAVLKTTTLGKEEVIKLRASHANSTRDSYVSSLPGYYSRDVYYPGSVTQNTVYTAYVDFPLPKSLMSKILAAEAIEFEVEAGSGTVEGKLSKQNIENLKKFSLQCFS